MAEPTTTTAQDERGYNGWTNYATWGVALVLDNDEGTYNTVRERAAELRREAPEHRNVPDIWTEEQAVRYDLADWLKDYTEELCGLEEDPGPSLMARQLLGAGLSDVDWHEIAGHYTDDEG